MSKSFRGILAVILLSSIPACIWLTLGSVVDRFSSGPAILLSLGQLGGLVGLAMMSLSVLLSTRIKAVDRLFGGFDKAIVVHRWLGVTGFLFVLVHPFLLAGQYAYVSVGLAWGFLWPWSNSAEIGGGFAALVIMIVIIPLVYVLRIKYHVWELSHRLLGVALFLGVSHMLEMESDTAHSFLLLSYMMTLSVLALVVWGWQSVVKLVYRGKREFRVSEVRRLSDAISEVTIYPAGNRSFSYRPGQFLFVTFDDDAVGRERHPFTIVSSPSEKSIRLAIKNLGDWSSKIADLKPGVTAWIEGPFGSFVPVDHAGRPQVWVGGGIGITPFMSAARGMKAGEYSGPVHLFYCVPDAKEAIFMNELLSIAEHVPELHIHLLCSNVSGHITAELVKSTVGELGTSVYWLCGPEAMVQSMNRQLRSSGVRGKDVHFEKFAFK